MKFLIVTALLVAVAYGHHIKLPEYAKSCEQDDPELNKCIKDSIQSMLPRLNNGIESLNIPPLDPFVVENSHFDYSNGAIQGSITTRNLRCYGITKATIKNVRMDIKDDHVDSEIEIHFPRIYMEGSYKADIKFNDLKMSPKGRFNVTMRDVDVTHKYFGRLLTKNGHKYLSIDDFDMEPEVGDMKFQATGLFPDPQLNNIAIDFVNQYWPAIYKMLLPETRVHWKPLMINSINEFLHHVPFDLLITNKDN